MIASEPNEEPGLGKELTDIEGEVVDAELIDVEDEAAAVVASTARVCVITGPSGAGKSATLDAACSLARSSAAVSTPHTLMWSDPLPYGILTCLSDLVAQLISEQGVARVVDRIRGAASRIAEDKARRLFAALGKEVLGAVRARLGPEFGDAITEAVKALQEEAHEALGARLARETPQLVRDVICGFAEEVRALAGDRRVVIALDKGERLNDDGQRLLVDLSEVLPEGIHIWIAMEDSSPAEFVVRTANDASHIPVLPLAEVTVARMLERAGGSPTQAAQVVRDTGGTAMDVRAYINLAARNELTLEATASAVAEDTLRRWDRLSPESQYTLGRLAVLPGPLPPELLLTYLGLSPNQWGRDIATLKQEGLLGVRQDGVPWLHDRRRKVVLGVMDAARRQDAYEAALTAIWHYVESEDAWLWLPALAEVALPIAETGRDDRGLDGVVRLEAEQLALAAAIIELTEESEPAIAGDALLGYARAFTGAAVRPQSALADLEAAGIVRLVATPAAAAVLPTWTPFVRSVVAGLCGLRLGFIPFPGIATTAFASAVFPALGEFALGTYGVGRASLAKLSEFCLGVEGTAFRPLTSLDRRRAQPSLIVRATYRDRPLYGAFTFRESGIRDAARTRTTGLEVEVLGEPFSVTTSLEYPLETVPADRFVRAVHRASRQHFDLPEFRGKQLVEPLQMTDAQELRIRARSCFRGLVDDVTAGAMGLEEPLSVHWSEVGEWFIELLVSGAGEASVEHPPEVVRELRTEGPFQFFELAEALDLPPGSSVRTLHEGTSKPGLQDPVLAEARATRERAIEFNASQRRVQVTLDESLAGVVEQAFRTELEDARRIAEILPSSGSRAVEVPSTTLYLAIGIEPAQERPTWVPGARSSSVWAELEGDREDGVCHAQLVAGIPRKIPDLFTIYEPTMAELARLPGFDEAKVVRSGTGVTRSILARLLRHREQDLQFGRPGEFLA